MRLSKRQIEAINLSLLGHTYTDIAKALGASLPTISNWFTHDPAIAAERERRLQACNVQAVSMLRNAQAKAAKALVEMLDSTADGTRLKAIELVSRMTGLLQSVATTTTNVQLNLTPADVSRELQRLRAAVKRDAALEHVPRSDTCTDIDKA